MATVLNGEKAGELATADFCERHASSSAQNFVRDFLAFDRNSPAAGRSRDPYDYAKKFTEYFLRHFEYELKRSSFGSDSLSEVNNAAEQDVARETRLPHNGQTDDYADQDSSPERGASPARKNTKGILRRFSFKNIRKSRLFKQTSDEEGGGGDAGQQPHLHHGHNAHRKQNKQRDKKEGRVRTNSTNDDTSVRKEGIVNVLQPGEDSRGKSRWEKTRLVLLKTTGGHLLEFYTPPKVIVIACCMLSLGPQAGNWVKLKVIGKHEQHILDVNSQGCFTLSLLAWFDLLNVETGLM